MTKKGRCTVNFNILRNYGSARELDCTNSESSPKQAKKFSWIFFMFRNNKEHVKIIGNS
jgi:hypothetical protein